ncbi:adenosine deaminase domain-containing protein 2 [Platysternon megacephalum]|uniref:Adenosine deaminase domain-containing protein 2 n=1 Tax=Platysternon megacephalum TaxID=55544 RepID=A0A4D9E1P5_9SAUR|nr:adenosine deaminase domain-containing protein 2 [Platysternon megacephalum]
MGAHRSHGTPSPNDGTQGGLSDKYESVLSLPSDSQQRTISPDMASRSTPPPCLVNSNSRPGTNGTQHGDHRSSTMIHHIDFNGAPGIHASRHLSMRILSSSPSKAK